MAAHEATLQTRQQEIVQIWKENAWLYAVGGFLAGVMFFPFLQLAVTNIAELLSGLVPEAIGILFTVLFIDVLYRRREEKSREKDLQDQLVRDASSLANNVAVNAVHQLRKRDWLTGEHGLLKGMNLGAAHLEGVNLEAANLEGVSLWDAHLEGATLVDAHLKGASLVDAHLEGAFLKGADLEGAFLRAAHLEGANLVTANLEGANLRTAHLEGASLWDARLEGVSLVAAHLEGANLNGVDLEGAVLLNTQLDEKTILPDGCPWTPDTDMSRFTDSTHPDFWRSDNPFSPAFRGKTKA